MQEKEVWKDIENYEGYYQISNKGSVKSLKRERCLKDLILSPSLVSKCYHHVMLSKNGESKGMYIHILVAIAFKGHKPDGRKTVVDHKDNDSLNNNASNIELITHRKNTSKDRFRYNYTSKYVGVYWYKRCKKWVASIWYVDKRVHLGYFENELDAAKAYQDKLKEINGTSLS